MVKALLFGWFPSPNLTEFYHLNPTFAPHADLYIRWFYSESEQAPIDAGSTRLKKARDHPAIDIHGKIDMPIALKLGNVRFGVGKRKPKPGDEVGPSLPSIPRPNGVGILSSAHAGREHHLNAAILE